MYLVCLIETEIEAQINIIISIYIVVRMARLARADLLFVEFYLCTDFYDRYCSIAVADSFELHVY